MKGFLLTLILLLSNNLFGQIDEVVLADTVSFVCAIASEMKNDQMEQEVVRLNFDDCNIEYSRSFAAGEWEVHEFWLVDLDEKEMKLSFDDKAKSWVLSLVCKNGDRKTQVTGSRFRPQMRSKVHFYNYEKKPLISIGNALFYAIRSCKGLDRFKDR